MPAIWLIDAYRAGERRQVRALAEAASQRLGWPCRTLQLGYRQPVFWPHLLRRASLAGVRRADRQQLSAPWPDLVISTGVRNEPVGRWLRQASGGHTRYVHVGRPWGRLQDFDLLVTTPQYRVPEHLTVLHNALTLHDLSAAQLTRSASGWAPRFAHLPRPWIAVLVGGNSGPYTLGLQAATQLLDQALTAASHRGGSLLVATSARTAPAVNAALRRRLADAAPACPHTLYCWGDAGDNPYPGMLALADAFVVSADSIAMLSETCATGRPVFMFDTGGMRRDAARHAPGAEALPAQTPRDWRLGGSLFAQLMRWCPDAWSRDISLIHRALEDSGRARWLDTAGLAEVRASLVRPGAPGAPDMQRALARIVALVGGRSERGS